MLGDVGRHQADPGPGAGEALGLPGSDAATTDHQYRHVVEVEEHRIGERGGGSEGHDQQCRNSIPYKVDLFGRNLIEWRP